MLPRAVRGEACSWTLAPPLHRLLCAASLILGSVTKHSYFAPFLGNHEATTMKRTKRWTLLALLLLPLGAVALLLGLCWPATFDVSDDLKLNGGYHLGTVYALQKPAKFGGGVVSQNADDLRPSREIIDLPIGTQIKIISIIRQRYVIADNLRHVFVTGQIMTGPAAGQSANLIPISPMEYVPVMGGRIRISTLDPEMLKPVP